MITRFFASLLLLTISIQPGAAHAQGDSPSIVDSVVIGAFAHEIASDAEDGADLNLELRLRPLFGRDWAIEILPTVGATANLNGDTNTAYLGATARYRFTPSVFVEGFFGLAAHDGKRASGSEGLDLGCDILFREGAGIGYQRGKHAITAYISHASHGDLLCDADVNEGMTSLGLRYGYHF